MVMLCTVVGLSAAHSETALASQCVYLAFSCSQRYFWTVLHPCIYFLHRVICLNPLSLTSQSRNGQNASKCHLGTGFSFAGWFWFYILYLRGEKKWLVLWEVSVPNCVFHWFLILLSTYRLLRHVPSHKFTTKKPIFKNPVADNCYATI